MTLQHIPETATHAQFKQYRQRETDKVFIYVNLIHRGGWSAIHEGCITENTIIEGLATTCCSEGFPDTSIGTSSFYHIGWTYGHW